MHNGSIETLDGVLDQRADVLAFLNSLTDDALLHDPRFADPWTQAAQETR
jgi:cytochrome c peroxidase